MLLPQFPAKLSPVCPEFLALCSFCPEKIQNQIRGPVSLGQEPGRAGPRSLAGSLRGRGMLGRPGQGGGAGHGTARTSLRGEAGERARRLTAPLVTPRLGEQQTHSHRSKACERSCF